MYMYLHMDMCMYLSMSISIYMSICLYISVCIFCIRPYVIYLSISKSLYLYIHISRVVRALDPQCRAPAGVAVMVSGHPGVMPHFDLPGRVSEVPLEIVSQ